MNTETLLIIITIVVVGAILAYLQRKALTDAIIEIVENQDLVSNIETVVEQQPQATQDLVAVLQRQLTLIEGLVRGAGLIDTPIGRVIDKIEDSAREITDANGAEKPKEDPETPAG